MSFLCDHILDDLFTNLVLKSEGGGGSMRRKGKTQSYGLLIGLGLDQHWQAVNIHLPWVLYELELVLRNH